MLCIQEYYPPSTVISASLCHFQYNLNTHTQSSSKYVYYMDIAYALYIHTAFVHVVCTCMYVLPCMCKQEGATVLVSCCLATKISKANSRPREGCGLVESSSMMRGGNS